MCQNCHMLMTSILQGHEIETVALGPSARDGHAEEVHPALRQMIGEAFAPCGHKECLLKALDAAQADMANVAPLDVVVSKLRERFSAEDLMATLVSWPLLLQTRAHQGKPPVSRLIVLGIAATIQALLHRPGVRVAPTKEINRVQ